MKTPTIKKSTKMATPKKMMNGGKPKTSSTLKKTSVLKTAPKKMVNGGKTSMVKKGVKKAQDGGTMPRPGIYDGEETVRYGIYFPNDPNNPKATPLPYFPDDPNNPKVTRLPGNYPNKNRTIPDSVLRKIIGDRPTKMAAPKKNSLGMSDSEIRDLIKLAKENGIIKEKNGGYTKKKMMNGGYSKKKMK